MPCFIILILLYFFDIFIVNKSLRISHRSYDLETHFANVFSLVNTQNYSMSKEQLNKSTSKKKFWTFFKCTALSSWLITIIRPSWNSSTTFSFFQPYKKNTFSLMFTITNFSPFFWIISSNFILCKSYCECFI